MAAHGDTDTNATSPSRTGTPAGWLSFLGNRLLLALLAVSLIPMAFMGMTTYRTASQALREQANGKLETVNTVTAKSVERYFDNLRHELQVLAEDRMTLDALKRFQTGLQQIVADAKADDQELVRVRRDLESFYSGDFTGEFRKRTGEAISAQPIVDALDDTAAYLQYLYIRRNENPIGSKHLLDAAGDDSAYTKAHADFHPIFRSLREKYGLSDVFLIDAAGGTVVYTVFKEIDFAASLRSGPLAGTSLAQAFQEAASAGRRDAVAFGRGPAHRGGGRLPDPARPGRRDHRRDDRHG
jgi:methyl-accepting chemotaxis protein